MIATTTILLFWRPGERYAIPESGILTIRSRQFDATVLIETHTIYINYIGIYFRMICQISCMMRERWNIIRIHQGMTSIIELTFGLERGDRITLNWLMRMGITFLQLFFCKNLDSMDTLREIYFRHQWYWRKILDLEHWIIRPNVYAYAKQLISKSGLYFFLFYYCLSVQLLALIFDFDKLLCHEPIRNSVYISSSNNSMI